MNSTKNLPTLLRILVEGVESKKESGARTIDPIIPRNRRRAVSMEIVDSRIALPEIKKKLPPKNNANIPIKRSFVTLPSSSDPQAIQ